MVGRRCAGIGQMGVGRLAVVATGLMQRVFSRVSGHGECRAPWVWTRRSLKAGVLRCGSRSGHGTSASRPKDGIDVLVTMSSGRDGQQVGGMEGGGGSGTYICAQDCDVLQVTEVRPQWSGGERSRRSESTFPTPSGALDESGGDVGNRDLMAPALRVDARPTARHLEARPPARGGRPPPGGTSTATGRPGCACR